MLLMLLLMMKTIGPFKLKVKRDCVCLAGWLCCSLNNRSIFNPCFFYLLVKRFVKVAYLFSLALFILIFITQDTNNIKHSAPFEFWNGRKCFISRHTQHILFTVMWRLAYGKG